jgi:hypothetical protein
MLYLENRKLIRAKDEFKKSSNEATAFESNLSFVFTIGAVTVTLWKEMLAN